MLNLLVAGTPDNVVNKTQTFITLTEQAQENLLLVFVVGIIIFIVVAVIVTMAKSDKEKKIKTKEQVDTENVLLEQENVLEKTEAIVENNKLTEQDVDNLKKYKGLFDSGIINQEEYDKAKNSILHKETNVVAKIKCPICGGIECSIINEVTTEGKDYEASKGCCGWFMWGPIGLLCGFCGEEKETINTNYWVCNHCGNKWKA